MPAPPDMAYWLGQKYSILGKQAEGQYQQDVANAYKLREEGGQVAPNAASLRALQGAQGFNLTAEGQLRTTQAGTEQKLQTLFDDPEKAGLLHDWLMQGGQRSGIWAGAAGAPEAGAPGAGAPGAGAPGAAPLQRQSGQSILQLPSLTRPLQPLLPATNLLNTNQPNQPNPTKPLDPSYLLPFRKGTANVKSPPGKGGKGGKAGGPPKGLEQLLPGLLAAMSQGGGAPGPAGPSGGAPAPAGPPLGGSPPMPGGAGMRKGSASVKGKGGKAGKAGASGGPPGGLEQMLPALMAASQASPAASPASASGAAPGALPSMAPAPNPQLPPGMARGAADAHPNPGYPFGAGYLFGATAVPGQGSGTVDTVNAKLAPHEAVLNRAAADKLGRGKIAALNAAGVKQMGLRRGTARVRAA